MFAAAAPLATAFAVWGAFTTAVSTLCLVSGCCRYMLGLFHTTETLEPVVRGGGFTPPGAPPRDIWPIGLAMAPPRDIMPFGLTIAPPRGIMPRGIVPLGLLAMAPPRDIVPLGLTMAPPREILPEGCALVLGTVPLPLGIVPLPDLYAVFAHGDVLGLFDMGWRWAGQLALHELYHKMIQLGPRKCR